MILRVPQSVLTNSPSPYYTDFQELPPHLPLEAPGPHTAGCNLGQEGVSAWSNSGRGTPRAITAEMLPGGVPSVCGLMTESAQYATGTFLSQIFPSYRLQASR